MRRADIISGAVIAAFGLAVVFVVIPIWVPGHAEGSYGLRAEDFPYLTAGLATALAALLFVRRLFFAREAAEDGAVPIPGRSWAFLAIAAAVLAATVILLDSVGILAGGPFAIAVFMVMMGERRPLAIVSTALLAPLGVWLFFWKLLEFPLP